MEQDSRSISTPLLESLPSETGAKLQTLGNFIVSIVGTGVLGFPFAFRLACWLTRSCSCRLNHLLLHTFLVLCREKLASEGSLVEAKTYGDLGYRILGITGRFLTETLVSLSQCGGAIACLLFIGQNLQSVYQGRGLTFTSYVLLLVPVEIGLSWIGSLSALAPSSIFADVCNVLAMGNVVMDDIGQAVMGKISFEQRIASHQKSRSHHLQEAWRFFALRGFG